VDTRGSFTWDVVVGE
jgi:hypothetical protein